MIGGRGGWRTAPGEIESKSLYSSSLLTSGVLKPKEFVKMYEKFFTASDANMFAQNVFRNFDADRNGSIDFTEFMIAIDVTSSGSPREKLMWAFR